MTNTQIDPLVQRVLSRLYKAERIYCRGIETGNDGWFTLEFVFPEYDRTVPRLEHVSANQMNEALLEGLYCCVAKAIETNSFSAKLSLEDLIQSGIHWILLKQEVAFKNN